MRTIEIRTPQNVVIDYQLASLRDRFLAMFIDTLIVGTGVFFVLMVLLSTVMEYMLEDSFATPIILGFFPLVTFFAYHLICEIMMEGQSFGKRAVGTKVVRLDGQEARLSDYLARAVFLIVDYYLSLGVLGALLIGSSAKAQRLGDLTAHTTVVRIKQDLHFSLTDILKINTLENYDPKYPEVKGLSEKDMLLLKQVLGRYQAHPNSSHRQAILQLYDRMVDILGVDHNGRDKIGFLKTLLRDYIVLTR